MLEQVYWRWLFLQRNMGMKRLIATVEYARTGVLALAISSKKHRNEKVKLAP